MHEASIARNIIDATHQCLEDQGISGRVRAIHLRVGQFTAVVPDNLKFIFSVLSEGSVLQGARLEIEEVPVRGRCQTCKSELTFDEPCFLCPACGSIDLELLAGRELLIDSLEVE